MRVHSSNARRKKPNRPSRIATMMMTMMYHRFTLTIGRRNRRMLVITFSRLQALVNAVREASRSAFAPVHAAESQSIGIIGGVNPSPGGRVLFMVIPISRPLSSAVNLRAAQVSTQLDGEAGRPVGLLGAHQGTATVALACVALPATFVPVTSHA